MPFLTRIPYFINDVDGRIYSVDPPARPDTPSAIAAEVPDTSILPLTGTPAGGGNLGDGWHILGSGFHLAEWGNGVLGAGTLHIDTDGTTLNDHVYYDFGSATKNLSGATDITVTLYSGPSEDRAGTFIALTLGTNDPAGPDAATGQIVLPLTVKAAGAKETVKVSLAGYPDSALESIRYIGFKAMAATEFAVWLKDLRIGSGLVGDLKYKICDVTVEGWASPRDTENVLISPEAPGPDADDLKVPAGSAGSQVSITRASVPEAGAFWQVWRNDEGVSKRYHFVANWPDHDRWQPETKYAEGDIIRPPTMGEGRDGDHQFFYTCTTAGTSGDRDEAHAWPFLTGGTITTGTAVFTLNNAATDKRNVLVYVDTSDDISDAEVLPEGRVRVPAPPTAIGVYDNRLLLYVTAPSDPEKSQFVGCLWGSGRGNPAEWRSWSPAEWPELEAAGLLNDASAFRLPISEAGQVMKMLPLGAWTGAAYTGPLAVLTQGGWTIALQGSVPSLDAAKDGLSVGHRIPVGCAGPYAACRDASGRILVVTPDGDVVAVSRELQAETLSEQLAPVLKGESA